MDYLLDKSLIRNLSRLYADPISPVGLANIYESHSLIFRWCEYLAYQNGIYSSAVNRLVSYFITKIEIKNVADEIREKLENILEYDLEIYDKLREIGYNFMVYGNCFISVIPPLIKFLVCPKCNSLFRLTELAENPDFGFKWVNFTPFGNCPSCHYSGKMEMKEVLDNSNPKRISIKLWNIHEISIKWDAFLRNDYYIWRIPGYFASAIKDGDPVVLNSTPADIIDAIKQNKYYRFHTDSILHLREPNLAGIIDRGWGIPRMLTIFPHLFFVQLMHRYNEALAMDYVIPTRVISPAAQASAAVSETGEPVLALSRSLFKSQMEKELAQQRRDPTRIIISPIPIQYQVLGGEAKALAPVELLSFGVDILLSSLGLPIEMYKGTMQVQAMPIALRIMENSMGFIPKILNRALRFIINKLCSIMNWPTPTVNLEKVTMADDLQRQLAKLQLMMQGLISQTSGLKALGIDMKEEFLRMLEDERFKSEASQKLQKQMQQEGQLSEYVSSISSQALNEALTGVQAQQPETQTAGGGGTQAAAAPTGAAGSTGGQQPIPPGVSPQQITLAALLAGQVPTALLQSLSPQDIEQVAQQIAQELFLKPEAIRLSELRKLKQIQPIIHARVIVIMEEMRNQMRLMGGEMIKQLQGMIT